MKKRILTVIGARPQIIKAAAISRAIRNKFSDRLEEMLVHTGQHYDQNMSDVFFSEMEIPRPAVNLGAGSASHAAQTAAMMTGLEETIRSFHPDAVLVYGDTNSTLAAALVASKMQIPVIHVEAGLRSFDKAMPEEINRVLCDHVSSILFAPTDTAVHNLRNEGFALKNDGPFGLNNPVVVKSGDVMFDNALHYAARAELPKIARNTRFVLATIHRDHNTDDAMRLKRLMEVLAKVSAEFQRSVILPLHPRTKEKISLLSKEGWNIPAGIVITEPMSYLQMIALESAADIILTDSGGVQKEAYFFRKPCVILRPHTEWVEIVANGNALLAGDSPERVYDAVRHFLAEPGLSWPEIFGNGKAAEEICAFIADAI